MNLPALSADQDIFWEANSFPPVLSTLDIYVQLYPVYEDVSVALKQ
jgi:hypothetical protein